jgi:hypothetical protein
MEGEQAVVPAANAEVAFVAAHIGPGSLGGHGSPLLYSWILYLPTEFISQLLAAAFEATRLRLMTTSVVC